MKIQLDVYDREFIEDYAKRFCEHKGKEASARYKRGSQTALELDIKGFSGEYAVHKYFGVDMPDFSKRYTSADMLIGFNGNEFVCDIKTTIYSKGGRKVLGLYKGVYENNKKGKSIDAFIAVEMNRNNTQADILGIISWERFLMHEDRIEFPNGDMIPCVDVKDLGYLDSRFTYLGS